MIFIDTGAFIARYVEDDMHHERANQLWREVAKQRTKLCTSSSVVNETITLLSRKVSKTFAVEKGVLIYHSAAFEILRSDQKLELAALEWMNKFKDQKVSFTDCLSFAFMKSHKITQYFGFDKHFDIAGFAAMIPRNEQLTI